jgi:hypothetical protein
MKRRNKIELPDMFDSPLMPEDIDNAEINKVEDLEDGSSVYEIGKPEEDNPKNDKFDANLALTMKEETLEKISTYILDAIDDDIKVRQPWLDIHNRVKKYLGHNLEDLEKQPFDQACRTFDTTLSTALIRFCATSRAELLPDSGPCGAKIFGQDSEELEEIAKVRSQWLNYFLTIKDSAYYKDFERSLYYIGFYGTIIKKVYYDDILKQPISRFIVPEDFLINIDCTSILESSRLTHILKLSAREVLINQKSGIYRDVELPYLKARGSDSNNNSNNQEADSGKINNLINLDSYKQRTLHDIYESHIYLNLETFEVDYSSEEITEVAKPYIVTIDKESREILSIKRNWREGDAEFKRRKYFVAYHFFTGFDIWGLGMARMSGTNAIAVTNMLRQTVDAATYQNLPAGFIDQGATKQQVTDIVLGAGQWKIMNTQGSKSIRDLFAPLPANGPSQSLMQLRQEIIAQMQDQLSTTELGMMDSKEDIPTGTAIAFLKEKNKIESSVLKSLHASFSEELRLLDDIFKEVVDREEFFINGEQFIITKEHFVDSVQVVPVSDPSVNSTIERIMKAEAIFQTAMQLPDKVNTIEALKMVFQAQGLDESLIDNLIIKPEGVEPADPITENMNMMQGKAVKAGIEQNHDAHIIVHSALEDNDAAKAHIQEHMAFKFMLEMEEAMGIDLTQIDQSNLEVQNMIALKAARAVEELGLNKHTVDNEPIDPNELLAAEIEQKREENIIKKEIADQNLEKEIFKSQLHFEEMKEKLKAEKEMALLEARVEMEKLRNRLGE